MTQKKTKKSTKKSGGGIMRFLMAVALLLSVFAAAISFSERKHWPEKLRNEDAVIALYQTRDQIIDSVWARGKQTIDVLPLQRGEKEPINVRPAKAKPEQGYNTKDRAGMDALIEKEGELP